jgi:tetrahydromethanopterin S-methyltransferase subunit B
MSLSGSDLCEVYGNSFIQQFHATPKPTKSNKTTKSAKNNSRKSKKNRHYEEKAKKAALMTNYDIDPFYNYNNGNDNLIEGFANFNSKPKPQVEVIKQETFDEESGDDNESDTEAEEIKIIKKPTEKVQCEMDGVNDKINELDTKINLLLEKLNDSSESEKSDKKTDETANIYDLILFVIFGIFFLLVLESISKLVVKNSMKYGGIQSIMSA